MQIGIVGLGRMGANIARRLMRHGHACVVHDRDPEPGRRLADEGASAAGGVGELVRALAAPRTVWVMLPAGDRDRGGDRRARRRCWRPAIRSSTAATRSGRTTSAAPAS